MVVSYLAHDPIPNFVETERQVRGLDRALVVRESRLAELGNELRLSADVSESIGRQLIALYRRTNKRHRPLTDGSTLPRHFEDDTDRNHHPAFRRIEIGREQGGVRVLLMERRAGEENVEERFTAAVPDPTDSREGAPSSLSPAPSGSDVRVLRPGRAGRGLPREADARAGSSEA
jgi:hypothetical protein